MPARAARPAPSNTTSAYPAMTFPWKPRVGGSRSTRRIRPAASPVRQGFEYAAFSSLRWFIVTNGSEWRLYKTQLKGSQSPLERLRAISARRTCLENRRLFLRFYATFSRGAFVPNRDGISRLDELRRQNEEWQQEIGDSLYEQARRGPAATLPRDPAAVQQSAARGRQRRGRETAVPRHVHSLRGAHAAAAARISWRRK